jgi:antitoxin HigA-1
MPSTIRFEAGTYPLIILPGAAGVPWDSSDLVFVLPAKTAFWRQPVLRRRREEALRTNYRWQLGFDLFFNAAKRSTATRIQVLYSTVETISSPFPWAYTPRKRPRQRFSVFENRQVMHEQQNDDTFYKTMLPPVPIPTTIPKKNPIHPGEILRKEFLAPLKISQSTLAEKLSIPLHYINKVCAGRERIIPEMAWMLSDAFGNSPEFWMNLQTMYDLSHARIHVGRLPGLIKRTPTKNPFSDPKIAKAIKVIRAYKQIPAKERFRQMVKAGVIDAEGRPIFKALLACARYGSGGRVTKNSPPVMVETKAHQPRSSVLKSRAKKTLKST